MQACGSRTQVYFRHGVIFVWWAFYYDLSWKYPDSRLWEYPEGDERWIWGYLNPRGNFIGEDWRVRGCETADIFYPQEWYPHCEKVMEILVWVHDREDPEPFTGSRFGHSGYALHPDPR